MRLIINKISNVFGRILNQIHLTFCLDLLVEGIFFTEKKNKVNFIRSIHCLNDFYGIV
jgi:hypothetical protein